MAKTLFKFFAIFIVVYFVLVLPQTNIEDQYAAFLRWQAQFFLGHFMGTGVAEFLPNTEANNWNFPTIVHIYNAGHYDLSLKTGSTFQITRISLDVYHDFLFAAFLFALIVATPLRWKQKTISLLAAMVLLHIYIDFTIYVELVNTFKNTPVLEAPRLQSYQEHILQFIYPVLRMNYGTGYFVALLIWIMVCFSKEDLLRYMQQINANK